METKQIHAENAVMAAKWLMSQGQHAFQSRFFEKEKEALEELKRALQHYLYPNSTANHFLQNKTSIEQLEHDLINLISCIRHVLPYLNQEAEHALREMIQERRPVPSVTAAG